MNRKNTSLLFVILTISLSFLTLTASVFAQSGNNFFGAVYTSMGDGAVVNQNLYALKEDVYLNGGPQNLNGKGLPDGTYYFQVTDPSGGTLLSTDPASCRQLKVVGGVVVGATGSCPHANGALNPTNGTMPVQLIPFNNTPNNGGEYKVHLIRQTITTVIASDGVRINFESKDSKTDNFKVKNTACTVNCSSTVTLSGLKFYDANANGLQDNGEAGLAGVKINIWLEGVLTATVSTDADGKWSVGVPAGANYKVCEILPGICPTDVVGSYWVQTAPAADSLGEQCYSGTAGSDVTGLIFGNVCFMPAHGGYTLGFWSNKNGQAILKSNDNFADAFVFLGALNLKSPDGSDFNPSSYPQFRSWLLSGNAVNMAYMLSVQLSATSLDVHYGSLSDGTIVDARSLGLGFPTIGSIRTAANTELNAPGGSLTFTGNPLRQDEEILKNALDAINNNRLPFASATPCGVCYP